MTTRLFFSIALLGAGFLGLASPVDAKVVCRDGFQQGQGGNWISTPYCNDEHLADIGRRHGMKVSGAQLRSDWGRKEDVCRLVGAMPTARDYCPEQSPEGRGH